MADDGGPGAQLGGGPGAPPGGVSRWIDLDGPVHYLDFGGAADGPLIVCVHGLGGAALNWLSLAPLLTPDCRVVAPDLAGHGLTQSAGRGAGVAANRLLLHRFLAALPSRPVILAGNSMGGMISLLEASLAPDAVAGLVLLDPALPFVLARPDPLVLATFAGYLLPGLGRLVPAARRPQGPGEVVASILRLCCADPSRVTADVIARHLELAQQRAAFPGAEQDFLAATRSVVATMGYPGRRDYRRRIRSAGCPVLLIHGTRDRLVPIAAARAAARANPSWTLIQFPGTGHVPQLEAPGETAQAMTGWLGSAGRSAASRAAAPGHSLTASGRPLAPAPDPRQGS